MSDEYMMDDRLWVSRVMLVKTYLVILDARAFGGSGDGIHCSEDR